MPCSTFERIKSLSTEAEVLWGCALAIWLVGAILSVRVLTKYALRRRKWCRLLPSNKLWFFDILGDLGKLPFLASWRNFPITALMLKQCLRHADTFKNEQLFCLWAGFVPIVVVQKREAVKELLTSKYTNEKCWIYRWFVPVIGDGLIMSRGEKWRTRRKLLTPSFHSDILVSFMSVFNEQSRRLVGRLREETRKEHTQLQTLFLLCTLDIICETTFGIKLGAFERNQCELVHALQRLTEMASAKMTKFWQWTPLTWYMNTGREAKKHIQVLKDLTKKIILEKKDQYMRGKKEIRTGRYKTLVEMLLEHHMQDETFTEDDVMEEAITFILAGYDTVAATLNWFFYVLGLHPEVQSNIHLELDKIFADDRNRMVNPQDINEMHYTERVLKESQRLFPAVSAFGRQSKEDMEICGYKVPKRTACFVLSYLLHRDPEVFPNPEKFDPDRFLPENSTNIDSFSYVPFSAGKRNCIGQKFALTEIKTIVATVLRHFTVESLDSREEISPSLEIVLVPHPPLKIKIRSRKLENVPDSN